LNFYKPATGFPKKTGPVWLLNDSSFETARVRDDSSERKWRTDLVAEEILPRQSGRREHMDNHDSLPHDAYFVP
jgi:hypothetical protein